MGRRSTRTRQKTSVGESFHEAVGMFPPPSFVPELASHIDTGRYDIALSLIERLPEGCRIHATAWFFNQVSFGKGADVARDLLAHTRDPLIRSELHVCIAHATGTRESALRAQRSLDEALRGQLGPRALTVLMEQYNSLRFFLTGEGFWCGCRTALARVWQARRNAMIPEILPFMADLAEASGNPQDFAALATAVECCKGHDLRRLWYRNIIAIIGQGIDEEDVVLIIGAIIDAIPETHRPDFRRVMTPKIAAILHLQAFAFMATALSSHERIALA